MGTGRSGRGLEDGHRRLAAVTHPPDGVTDIVGDDAKLEDAIRGIGKLGRLTPRGIRTHLGLNKPIYQATAAYGHFGRSAEGDLFPWERLDLVEDLKAGAGVEALPVEA